VSAYYNEIDPYAAQWLRNLIARNQIAPGDVDERDIRDVRPSDLRGYTQCHFFAGIGIWSLALRRAGWLDTRPVWTGSCPCQPFSAAGKGGGFDDERHLWPDWHHLIRQCRPAELFGEQVAGKNGTAWFDLVSADMEADDYAIGAIIAPAAGFGAPQIRERQYWAAHDLRSASIKLDHCGSQRWDAGRHRANGGDGRNVVDPAIATCGLGDGRRARLEGLTGNGSSAPRRSIEDRHAATSGSIGTLGDAIGERCEWRRSGKAIPQSGSVLGSEGLCDVGQLGDTHSQHRRLSARSDRQEVPETIGHGQTERIEQPGPVNGFWSDADWLLCRDGKWRPVEPGTFPLAHGAASRVGRLRAYGNAICLAQAEGFVSDYMGR